MDLFFFKLIKKQQQHPAVDNVLLRVGKFLIERLAENQLVEEGFSGFLTGAQVKSIAYTDVKIGTSLRWMCKLLKVTRTVLTSISPCSLTHPGSHHQC